MREPDPGLQRVLIGRFQRRADRAAEIVQHDGQVVARVDIDLSRSVVNLQEVSVTVFKNGAAQRARVRKRLVRRVLGMERNARGQTVKVIDRVPWIARVLGLYVDLFPQAGYGVMNAGAGQ